jgi:hypothetical protein
VKRYKIHFDGFGFMDTVIDENGSWVSYSELKQNTRTVDCPDCKEWEATLKCPECGSASSMNHNILAENYQMCTDCKQEYYTDINYCKTCKGTKEVTAVIIPNDKESGE